MNKRQLGSSGIEVAPLAFGGNVFGWTADEPASFRLLDAFVAGGCNLIDTADAYSRWVPGHKGGESETVIGNWLKARGKRDKVVIATKVGMEVMGHKGLSRAHIMRSVEGSLARLQTDYIDLYQSHIDDETVPQEETLAAYAELIEEGKVRAIGASNFSGARLAESIELSERLGFPKYVTLQPEYNLYDRAGYETELEPVCLANGIGVISYYSLASGFLSGKYRSKADIGKSVRGEFVAKYFTDRGFRILDALDRVADQHRTSQASVALAWLIARPSVTAPIASATTVEQLNTLIEATRLELDRSSIELLNQASA